MARLDVNSGEWLLPHKGGFDYSGNAHCVTPSQGGTLFVGGWLNNMLSLSADAFVGKIDLNGNWIWFSTSVGSGEASTYCLACDACGNCYAGIRFSGTESLGGNTFCVNNTDNRNFVAAKLDPCGNWLWARAAGGNSVWSACTGIVIDGEGNSYVCGCFSGTLEMAGQTLVSSDIDVLVAKLSATTIPLPPQNLTLSTLGNNLSLSWNPVNANTCGEPIIPDFYCVYYNPDSPYGPFTPLTLVLGTSYYHYGAAQNRQGFYQVRAVVLNNRQREDLESGRLVFEGIKVTKPNIRQ